MASMFKEAETYRELADWEDKQDNYDKKQIDLLIHFAYQQGKQEANKEMLEAMQRHVYGY